MRELENNPQAPHQHFGHTSRTLNIIFIINLAKAKHASPVKCALRIFKLHRGCSGAPWHAVIEPPPYGEARLARNNRQMMFWNE